MCGAKCFGGGSCGNTAQEMRAGTACLCRGNAVCGGNQTENCGRLFVKDRGPRPHFSAYLLQETKMTWQDARLACQAQGRDLAVIRDSKTNAAVHTLVGAKEQAWIGLHDVHDEKNFTWVDGTLLSAQGYRNWESGEPNNYNNDEDCAYMVSGHAERWNDAPCSRLHVSVCSPRKTSTYKPFECKQQPTCPAGQQLVDHHVVHQGAMPMPALLPDTQTPLPPCHLGKRTLNTCT